MSSSRIDHLARLLSDRSRIGLTTEIADRLKLRPEDALRGQLLSEEEDDRGHFGVYLLGAYVVDDTDVWGDGEIYWWSIPTLVERSGKATWSTTSGLPSGAPPHKVGSLEWMTNFSLAEPPLHPIAVLEHHPEVRVRGPAVAQRPRLPRGQRAPARVDHQGARGLLRHGARPRVSHSSRRRAPARRCPCAVALSPQRRLLYAT